jgi:hypothetical protein
VGIAAADMNTSEDHIVRITAPGIDDRVHRGLQFEGMWINTGGALISSRTKIKTIQPGTNSDAASIVHNTSAQSLQRGLVMKGGHNTTGFGVSDSAPKRPPLVPRKTLEIVSDLPRILGFHRHNGSLAAAVGWEDLIGDMFRADHVSIGVHGMCLLSPCIGGVGQPASIKDTFFRRYSSNSLSFTSPN